MTYDLIHCLKLLLLYTLYIRYRFLFFLFYFISLFYLFDLIFVVFLSSKYSFCHLCLLSFRQIILFLLDDLSNAIFFFNFFHKFQFYNSELACYWTL